MRPSGRAVLAGAVTLLAAWALVQTLDWPAKTTLYPRAVGIPLLILAAAETLLCLRHRDEADTGSAGGAIDLSFSTALPPEIALRRAASVLAWMGGFYVTILLIGFPRAIPLFMVAYLRGPGKEPWTTALLLAAAAWLGFYLMFVRLLHLPFAAGWLWSVFFR